MKKAKHWYDYLWVCAILYFTLGFFNILFAHVGIGSNRNALLFSGAKLFCGNVDNTVCIDIESNFDLRNTSSCWCDTVQTELS